MLPPWKESYDNLDSILKSRDITLPTKVPLVQAMVFPVVMYGCESWTVKKAEHPKIDAFELWCWRRLLRVPWATRRSNQSLKEVSPGCSLEGLMLKLKLQYFGHFMRRVDSLEKTLMLGGIGGRRRRGRQRMRWLDGIPDSMDMGLGRLWELVNGQGHLACHDSWGHRELDMTEWLKWTELNFSFATRGVSLLPKWWCVSSCWDMGGGEGDFSCFMISGGEFCFSLLNPHTFAHSQTQCTPKLAFLREYSISFANCLSFWSF